MMQRIAATFLLIAAIAAPLHFWPMHCSADDDAEPITRVFIQFRRGDRSVYSALDGQVGVSARMSLPEIVDQLRELPELCHVRIQTRVDEDLKIEEYRQLARLRMLEELHVETHGVIEGPELEPLTSLMRLKSLEFEEARVRLAVIQTLIHCPSLRTFRIPFAGEVWELELDRLDAKFRIYETANYAP